MILLIDYDNLPRLLKRTDLAQVIKLLLTKIALSTSAPINRISCRLYGGWLERKKMSKKAQRLSKQIDQYFPLALSLSEHTNVIVDVELARALACDPQHDFTHTFRRRSKPRFQVKRFPLEECVEPMRCSIRDVNFFIYHNVCPHVSCNVTPETAFYQAEQKLV